MALFIFGNSQETEIKKTKHLLDVRQWTGFVKLFLLHFLVLQGVIFI